MNWVQIVWPNVTYSCGTVVSDVVFGVTVGILLKNTKRDGVTQDKFLVSAGKIISRKHSKCASYCVGKQSCERGLLVRKKHGQELYVELC